MQTGVRGFYTVSHREETEGVSSVNTTVYTLRTNGLVEQANMQYRVDDKGKPTVIPTPTTATALENIPVCLGGIQKVSSDQYELNCWTLSPKIQPSIPSLDLSKIQKATAPPEPTYNSMSPTATRTPTSL